MMFLKIHRKTPVTESLCNKAAGLRQQMFSCKFCEIFKSIFFTEQLPTTVFEMCQMKLQS